MLQYSGKATLTRVVTPFFFGAPWYTLMSNHRPVSSWPRSRDTLLVTTLTTVFYEKLPLSLIAEFLTFEPKQCWVNDEITAFVPSYAHRS